MRFKAGEEYLEVFAGILRAHFSPRQEFVNTLAHANSGNKL